MLHAKVSEKYWIPSILSNIATLSHVVLLLSRSTILKPSRQTYVLLFVGTCVIPNYWKTIHCKRLNIFNLDFSQLRHGISVTCKAELMKDNETEHNEKERKKPEMYVYIQVWMAATSILIRIPYSGSIARFASFINNCLIYNASLSRYLRVASK